MRIANIAFKYGEWPELSNTAVEIVRLLLFASISMQLAAYE